MDLSSGHDDRMRQRAFPRLTMLLPYRLVVGAVRAASPVFALGSSKLARGMAGRRRAHELLAGWGHGVRDRERPVAWFHAPSVGEGLQAQAVMEALVARMPDLQTVFTFFSPSAETLARNIGADVATYLPWDLRGPTSTVLDAIEPAVVVFTKTEVWPVLVREAARREIATGIVGGTVPEGAGRLRPAARAFLGGTWRQLSFACANTDSDAGMFADLGVSGSALHTLGDPGIDSALDRFRSVDSSAAWLSPFETHVRPTVVAGSTWPSDEAVLLPALNSVRSERSEVRAVIAPHEPDPAHVDRLCARLRASGWRTETLTEVEADGSAQEVDAVVVDRIGVLAHLYSIATVSYVGGGFHDAGLHSVLEPAAAGTPIVFGPRHSNARAAADLVEEGGADVAPDAAALGTVLLDWLESHEERERRGRAALDYIEAHRGAAERTASLLDPLIRRATE